MKKLIFILALSIGVLGFNTVMGANFASISDGLWENGSTWGVSTPPNTATADDITISAYDSVYTDLDITIKSLGYFNIKYGGVLVVHNMEFANGSHVNIEYGGKLIINNDFTNKNNSDKIIVNGKIYVGGNLYNGNGGDIIGIGSITVLGTFTGTGTTFGYQNNTLPPNSTVSGISLPVELINFSYKISPDNIELNWETASETDNDYFTIEKSENGNNFEYVGTVKGSGYSNSVIKYYLYDKLPMKGIYYYRLSQTDYNGTTTYLKTIACNIYKNKSIFTVLQNPLIDETFQINYSGESGKYLLNIYNATGQIVSSKIFVSENNSGIFNLNRSGMKGYYIISLTGPSGKTSSFPVIFN